MKTKRTTKIFTLILIFAGIIFSGGLTHAITTTDWTEYASNPVYAPGKAYYPTILKEGSTYTMWSDSATGVQKATSTDGVNWTTVGSVTGLMTPKHTLVEKIGSSYRMWYWPNLGYSINDIRTATSTDGLTWTGDQAITQVGTSVIVGGNDGSIWNRGSYGPADVIYNPAGSSTIVEPTNEASVWANKFVMYYDGTSGGTEDIGLAVSNDGINWQGYNGGVAPVLAATDVIGDWDRTHVSRATVLKENDDAYHMWYSGGNGNMQDGIGYAFSTDGINWTRDVSNPIFHKSDGVAWRNDRTYTPMVIGDEMWFTGRDSSGSTRIGYATGPVPTAITLASFDAKPGNRKVTLIWETATEIDNAGFNILRAESENGEYVKINDAIIPAKAGAAEGASYQFIDSNTKNRTTYYYKLQDIDLNGNTTDNGPKSATPRLIFGFGK